MTTYVTFDDTADMTELNFPWSHRIENCTLFSHMGLYEVRKWLVRENFDLDEVSVGSCAEAAKFQMNFAVQMLNVGRVGEANKCFENANRFLDALIEDGQ